MLRFVKSSLRRLLELQRKNARAPKGTASGRRRISLTGSDESKYQPDKLLDRVRDSNVVMFPFGLLLRQVCSESRIPFANEPGGIEQGVTEIMGASFLHMGISVIQFARLVCGWRQSSIS